MALVKFILLFKGHPEEKLKRKRQRQNSMVMMNLILSLMKLKK
jgi:hypothetical protein